jgi:hypothetical protein
LFCLSLKAFADVHGRIEDINKSCLEEFRAHYECLDNNNQQLWQCRPAEWRLNKCVFHNLVRNHPQRPRMKPNMEKRIPLLSDADFAIPCRNSKRPSQTPLARSPYTSGHNRSTLTHRSHSSPMQSTMMLSHHSGVVSLSWAISGQRGCFSNATEELLSGGAQTVCTYSRHGMNRPEDKDIQQVIGLCLRGLGPDFSDLILKVLFRR